MKELRPTNLSLFDKWHPCYAGDDFPIVTITNKNIKTQQSTNYDNLTETNQTIFLCAYIFKIFIL